MQRTHVNERLRTGLANSGRVAGSGMLYDRYDEESGGKNYNKKSALVVFPNDYLEDPSEKNGPVIIIQEANSSFNERN